MANLQDWSINVKPETTPVTPVTPDRAFESNDESLDFQPTIVQGSGIRAGTYMDRSTRRTAPVGQGGGDVTMDILSKGFGYWWQAIFGTVTSTLVSGTTWQQVHTWAKSASSLTVQKTSIRADGTVDPVTYAGCVVESWELTFPNSGIPTLKVTLDIADYATGTAFATLTYPAAANVFHFGNLSVSTGTFTAPTTIAIATGATPLTNVRSLTLTGNRNPVDDRFNAVATGRKSAQIATKFDVTGSMEQEYTSTAQRDAYLAQTGQSLVATCTAGALSTGLETLQVGVAEYKIDGGGVPMANGTGLITQTVNFTVLDNLVAAQPIYLVARTADATV